MGLTTLYNEPAVVVVLRQRGNSTALVRGENTMDYNELDDYGMDSAEGGKEYEPNHEACVALSNDESALYDKSEPTCPNPAVSSVHNKETGAVILMCDEHANDYAALHALLANRGWI
jgi:xanthine/CO dehydrogenase XdhC/CoxF family maturation factor